MSKERHNSVEDESEIESKVVTVGSNQGYKALIIVMVVLLVGGVYYLYFSPSNKEGPEIVKKEETKQNIQELKGKLEQVPDNVVVSERIATDLLPPLPPLPIPQVIPEVKQIKKEEVIKKEEQLKEIPLSNIPVLPKQNFPSSNVMGNLPTSFPTIGGGGYPKERRSAQMLAISGSSGEGKATDAVLSDTSAQSSKATKAGKLGLMIIQGKVIDAILETAISSDLQGMLRAVVSRDVYAETGDTILIPKGSRLIGGYSFDSNVAKARVNINWNRIILPHGIDVAIASSGTDELGRAGIAGIVDNKIVSALFSSVALAGVSIGSAVIGQKASNIVDTLTAMDAVKSITATEIDFSSLKDVISDVPEGTSSDKWKLGFGAIGRIQNAKNEQELLRIMRKEIAKALGIGEDKVNISLEDINQLLRQFQKKSKSVYDEAIGKSINDFSKDMRDIVGRYTDKKPTIYVNQGTALKVFVNQDIVFPPQAILNN
ncbi:TrbI/VirB10 family protein [Wolbachia endosymbiont of Diaphorina citri]|jgi:Type IV secretory pathway, VirB10 components|uniref:TrbI/VirB10 family protein n=1 Tax=Wolbachia endosymbiont of Diaphorina citri TaxID=116598 RepID=UPI0002EBB629|nr:TrbI/VirB10 family protein [Wolbachia endosymbiont of Diaphorina citri]QJT94092.1 TrbI/VirB10 family protein [Wolbachia endosymbiont of Diaphorina citri]QJT95333.1 TrbI/VirB10 family protein [Wolbachia endosymbiont of Diaphorina citri]QJT96695.1 TrbI/VirB10 family protein [Wolbachia endosymbiont of Diaphorina citri]QLK10991.1 TrbI/VirB10 family protein [Wolbachia endosymbiont of Diaphorina citri]QXY87477.1 TrbI/VirB10 family protein [Wolbachia endosymbiont of Diaphorina citri]